MIKNILITIALLFTACAQPKLEKKEIIKKDYSIYKTYTYKSKESVRTKTIRAVEGLYGKIKEDVETRAKEYFLVLGMTPDQYKKIPEELAKTVAAKALSNSVKFDDKVTVGIRKKEIRDIAYSFLVSNPDDEAQIKAFAYSFDTYF